MLQLVNRTSGIISVRVERGVSTCNKILKVPLKLLQISVSSGKHHPKNRLSLLSMIRDKHFASANAIPSQ